MLAKLEAIHERYQYLEEQLSDPEAVGDMKRFKKVSKAYKDLKEIVEVYKIYKKLLGNIETSQEMLNEEDPEMKEMARMELEELLPQKEAIEEHKREETIKLP